MRWLFWIGDGIKTDKLSRYKVGWMTGKWKLERFREGLACWKDFDVEDWQAENEIELYIDRHDERLS